MTPLEELDAAVTALGDNPAEAAIKLAGIRDAARELQPLLVKEAFDLPAWDSPMGMAGIGAAGGGLLSGLATLGQPKEKRRTMSHMLTGAMAGGLGGAGLGYMLPSLQGAYKEYANTNAKAQAIADQNQDSLATNISEGVGEAGGAYLGGKGVRNLFKMKNIREGTRHELEAWRTANPVVELTEPEMALRDAGNPTIAMQMAEAARARELELQTLSNKLADPTLARPSFISRLFGGGTETLGEDPANLTSAEQAYLKSMERAGIGVSGMRERFAFPGIAGVAAGAATGFGAHYLPAGLEWLADQIPTNPTYPGM